MRTAQKIFDDELSGEPLSEDVVIEAIKTAMKEAIEQSAHDALGYIIQPTLNGGSRACVSKESILKLLKKI